MARRLICGVVTVFWLASCGSPRPEQQVPPKVSARMSAAATATQAAGAVRVVFSGTSSGAGGAMKMKGFGVADPASEHSKLVMDMGESDLLGDLGTMEAVSDGLTMYMKWPLFSRLLPDAKPWLKMDLDAIGKKMGIDLGSLMQLGGQNPASSVGYLWGAKDVETVGHPKINGVATTHYTSTVDFELAARQAPEEMRDEVRSSLDRLTELIGASEFPFEVWLDEDDLVRRMKMTMDFSHADPSMGIPSMTMTQTTDFLKYGVKASFHLPSPSNVTDLMQLIEDGGGSAPF